MGQLIRTISAIFAAGLLCFHCPQPQGSFLGLGVWIVLMMVWVGLMGENIRQRTFSDIQVCSKEDYPKMIEDFMRFRAGGQPTKSVKASGETTRPMGSASPVELVCSAAVIASAALGAGPVLAAAMVFQGHKAIINPKGDWLKVRKKALDMADRDDVKVDVIVKAAERKTPPALMMGMLGIR